MGLRDRVRGRRGRAKPDAEEIELFDEEFLRRLELLQVAARRLVRGRNRAERKTKKTGSGLEFADHREYSPGDDIRNVDWNVLMRLEQTLIRLYEEDEDLPLRLVVDVSDSMLTGGRKKLHMAMQVAAALGYIGLAGLDRVGISAISKDVHETLPAIRGKGRIFRLFEFLRNTAKGGPTDLRSGCTRVAAQSKQPGVTVVLSDFYDLEGAFEGLNRLRFRKHEVVCIQIIDPVEAKPQASGLRGDVRIVDVEGSTSRDVTLTPRTLKAYAQAHEEFCQQLERDCRSRGIPYFRADTTQEFDELVLRIFRLGGVLR